MSESGAGAPPAAATFESLETELEAATRKLEDASVPLEARLRLHARATSMHRRLEAIVEAARKATGPTEKDTAAAEPTAGGAATEPYETVRDRLAEVVNALEDDRLPLVRVVELHGEAQRLAARCEAILDGAQQQIAEAAGEADGSAATGDPPSTSGEDSTSDAPF